MKSLKKLFLALFAFTTLFALSAIFTSCEEEEDDDNTSSTMWDSIWGLNDSGSLLRYDSQTDSYFGKLSWTASSTAEKLAFESVRQFPDEGDVLWKLDGETLISLKPAMSVSGYTLTAIIRINRSDSERYKKCMASANVPYASVSVELDYLDAVQSASAGTYIYGSIEIGRQSNGYYGPEAEDTPYGFGIASSGNYRELYINRDNDSSSEKYVHIYKAVIQNVTTGTYWNAAPSTNWLLSLGEGSRPTYNNENAHLYLSYDRTAVIDGTVEKIQAKWGDGKTSGTSFDLSLSDEYRVTITTTRNRRYSYTATLKDIIVFL